MEQRTGNILFSEVANEMTEFAPIIDKKQLAISYKGDFWVNQYFYKQQHNDAGKIALTSNLDFIPPDLKDEGMRRSLYQKTVGCSLDTMLLRAQKNKSKKIQCIEIGRDEQ